MDAPVMLGPLKFSLRATIDHHRPSTHSGHYTASINSCKNIFYCNDNKITKFDIVDSKNSTSVYVILYWLTYEFWTRTGGWDFHYLLWLWHILATLLMAARGISAETCGLGDVFPSDDLCCRPEILCWYIYMYIFVCIMYASSGYMTYIHTHELSFSTGEAATHHSP